MVSRYFYSVEGAKQLKKTAFKWQESPCGDTISMRTLSTKMKPYVTKMLMREPPMVLIPNKVVKNYQASDFASLLPNIIEEFIDGRRFGSTLARHSFIMKVRTRGENTKKGQKAVSNDTLNRIAEFMGHSKGMQASYDRVNLTNEEDEEDEEDDENRFLKGSELTSADVYKDIVEALQDSTSLDVEEKEQHSTDEQHVDSSFETKISKIDAEKARHKNIELEAKEAQLELDAKKTQLLASKNIELEAKVAQFERDAKKNNS